MQHNNDNKKYVYYDSSNVKHEIEIEAGDFKLKTADKKMHDTKFKTKPTTFAKDAFKRFCKNKSSVAGAIIVGLLLLCAIFVPIIDQYDVDSNHPQERLLEPKLFNAGTGFWDGTKRVTGIIADQSNVAYTLNGVTYYYPFEDSYSSSAIISGSLTAPVQSYVNTASSGVTGGYVRVTNSNQLEVEDEDLYEDNKITYSSYSYAFDKDNTYSLDITFGDEEIEDLQLGTYRVYLSYSIETDGVSGNTVTGTFTDFTAYTDSSGEDNEYPFSGTWTGDLGDLDDVEIVINDDLSGTFNGSEVSYAVTSNYLSTDSSGNELYSYTITGNGTTSDASGNDIGFEFTLEYSDENPSTLGVSYTTSEVYELVLTGNSSNDGYISTYEEFYNSDILSGLSLADNQEIDSLQICIDVLPGVQISTYILIESIEITTNSESSSEQNVISNMGYTDANASLLLSTSSYGYWRCDGSKNLYKGTAYTISFTYDTYAAAYGNMLSVVPVTTIKQYAENGWLSSELLDDDYDWYQWYTASVRGELDELFESIKTDLTDSMCSIMSIYSVSTGVASNIRYYTITCYVSKYKLLGYTSMPRFLLGTDSYGRDLLKVTFVGLRNSFLIAIGIAVFCFLFGLVWGAISGYYGGNVDIVMERITDFLNAIPWIVIVTLCVLNLGTTFGVFLFAMCFVLWITPASVTRTQFYRFRDREYTLACRTLGAGNIRLIFKHILPNSMGTIITSCVLIVPNIIFVEANVAYLGLGFTDIISLGVTLSDNQQYLSTYPYLIIFPALVMSLLMISFNLLGNGLRDAFNPSLKGSE